MKKYLLCSVLSLVVTTAVADPVPIIERRSTPEIKKLLAQIEESNRRIDQFLATGSCNVASDCTHTRAHEASDSHGYASGSGPSPEPFAYPKNISDAAGLLKELEKKKRLGREYAGKLGWGTIPVSVLTPWPLLGCISHQCKVIRISSHSEILESCEKISLEGMDPLTFLARALSSHQVCADSSQCGFIYIRSWGQCKQPIDHKLAVSTLTLDIPATNCLAEQVTKSVAASLEGQPDAGDCNVVFNFGSQYGQCKNNLCVGPDDPKLLKTY